jgi:hypothetical protein
MKSMTRFLALAGVLAAVGAAQAVVLNPGQTALTPGMNFPFGNHTLIGWVNQNVTGMNALNQVTFTGVLEHWVWQHNTTGHLSFLYRFNNDATSQNAVHRITMTNFAGFMTNADWITNGTGNVRPHFADRSADGGTIGFNWTDPVIGGQGHINPGQMSWTVAIMTNATQFTLGTTNLIDGGVASVTTFAPVPEPASMAALGLGALGLLARRRRRKN